MGQWCGRFGRAGVMSVRPRVSIGRVCRLAAPGQSEPRRPIRPRAILSARDTVRAQYAKCLDT